MTTQVQIRGAANATQQARTLASRELDIDTTNWRLAVHDGSTAGGIEHVNWIDLQNQRMVYAAASGTNTITANFSPAPTALAAGMAFYIKAANTNTGACTFSPNGLSAANIYKKDAQSGTLIALVSGDIIQNGIYRLVYDGTQWQLEGGSGGLVSVSQGDLNTSVGSVSVSTALIGSTPSDVTLPGGAYGFWVQTRKVMSGGANSASGTLAPFEADGTATTAYATRARLTITKTSGASLDTFFAQQRYITASPPFDMGDGEAGGFGFLKVNKSGEIVATYFADVPPWGYNGPTDIRACKKCPITGTKYRKVMKKRTLEQIMDGAEVEYEYEPITQKIKNADMALIPHPFGDLAKDETIVLLDPMDDRIRRLTEYQNAGGDIAEFLAKIKPDNERLRRKGPKGVMQARFSV